jgi:hypothetical protein
MCKRLRYGLPSGHAPRTRGAYDFDRLSSELRVDHVCPGPLRVRPCAQMSPHEAVPLSKAESLPQKTNNTTKPAPARRKTRRPCAAQCCPTRCGRSVTVHGPLRFWLVSPHPMQRGATTSNAVQRGAAHCNTALHVAAAVPCPVATIVGVLNGDAAHSVAASHEMQRAANNEMQRAANNPIRSGCPHQTDPH